LTMGNIYYITEKQEGNSKYGAVKMDKQLVVKSNKLNEARYRLSVQEQRIILTMVSMIKPEDVDFKPYRFTIKEFAELAGLSGESVYSQVKKITATLRNKGFTIKEPDGDLQIGWISSAKYYDQQGCVEFCFDPKLKPYLLALKKEFTRYQLKNTIKLKSVYSVRIYELLKQYQAIGYREFDLQELRSVLGIPAGSLEPYANFRMKVLDIARRELTTADICFAYTPLKTKRKVTGIRFDIRPNIDAIKRSKKPKSEKVENNDSAVFDLIEQRHRQEHLDNLLRIVQDRYPEKFNFLYTEAYAQVVDEHGDNFRGQKTLIRFKLHELVESFIKANKLSV